jgi:hypothetical protein
MTGLFVRCRFCVIVVLWLCFVLWLYYGCMLCMLLFNFVNYVFLNCSYVLCFVLWLYYGCILCMLPLNFVNYVFLQCSLCGAYLYNAVHVQCMLDN